MDYIESLRSLSGSALDAIARALYERDTAAFERALVELTRCGTMSDYQKAAEMLANIPMRVKSSDNTYADARFGSLVSEVYLNMYLRACGDCGCGANEYMPMLLSAQYAKAGSALGEWDKSVDRYLENLARTDFDLVADYVDKYDKKFGKYRVLIAVDRSKALDRLLALALYGKHIDKAAVRDILMDYDDILGRLTAMYSKVSAHERVAVVRLLLTFKNDGRVRNFIENVVMNDRSKSVRDAASGGTKIPKIKDAARYMEKLMSEGAAYSLSEWQKILAAPELAEVADRIFFSSVKTDGRIRVLVYNDGKFLDSFDRPIADPDTVITVLHPLDLAGENSELLSLNISQPFKQLGRTVFHPLSDERYYSDRFCGTMILRSEFAENLNKYGFAMCSKRSDGEPETAVYISGKFAVCVECDIPERADTVSCGRIMFYRAADVVRLKRKLYVSSASRLDIGALPLRDHSELVYRVSKLFDIV